MLCSYIHTWSKSQSLFFCYKLLAYKSDVLELQSSFLTFFHVRIFDCQRSIVNVVSPLYWQRGQTKHILLLAGPLQCQSLLQFKTRPEKKSLFYFLSCDVFCKMQAQNAPQGMLLNFVNSQLLDKVINSDSFTVFWGRKTHLHPRFFKLMPFVFFFKAIHLVFAVKKTSRIEKLACNLTLKWSLCSLVIGWRDHSFFATVFAM